MYPPEGCPPLAGWKRHACQCPPRPVFCPGRPRPLDPGCAAKPLYTVLERIGAQSLPGEFSQEGGTAAPLVRCAERLSRPWPRFAPARESRERGRFGLEPKTPRTFEEGASAYPFGLGPNGCCHKTPLHCARSGRASQLAGEGSLRLAVRAESLGSEGRCFGLEANGHCHDWASTTATEESPARDCPTAASASRTKFLYELVAPAMACTCETSPPASRNCAP